MKLKPSYGLIPILAVGMFISTPDIGQEEKMPIEYESTVREVKAESDLTESEFKTPSKPAVTPPINRETETPAPATVPTKSVKAPVKPVEKTQKPEDPLSFNFLYYIIEKFKMSDMIE
jgi:hypothetical protein